VAAVTARSLTVVNCVRRTISDDDCLRQPRAFKSKDRRNSLARHKGTIPWKHLNMRTVSLCQILSRALSLCRDIKSYFDDEALESLLLIPGVTILWNDVKGGLHSQ